ncbi:ribokinase [Pararhizobium antarcticum]|uniref:Ribokinase n=1 Tax=Pararhizobium antarcticum TaxID=1798805 RepID=A0A657LLK1_9HYPH|nr:ribokinase [Pararhizobium antarcticum]OJF90068.1 ribokinase [Pararhizobium antarcticum]
MKKSGVCILGVFVADTAYVAKRLPNIGETIAASGFSVGPGGKGSNQAVAAARAGANVSFISKIGMDAFGDLATKTFASEGIKASLTRVPDMPTGAAFIYVNETNGDNAVIVYPGAAGSLSPADVDAHAGAIQQAAVFVTQLEQPATAALRGLKIAKASGVVTVFNPAPAETFPTEIYRFCDYVIPNETEAASLVGFGLENLSDARRAGDFFLERGVAAAVITLGSRGVLYHTSTSSIHIPAFSVGTVIDTTGAGDAFVGGFSAALSEAFDPVRAVTFGCAAAGIAVTRRGTAGAMPYRSEIEVLAKTAAN